MNVQDTDPAFPFNDLNESVCNTCYPGMTLRYWFAGMAMQGIMANRDFTDKSFDQVALMAWNQADAMSKANGIKRTQ